MEKERLILYILILLPMRRADSGHVGQRGNERNAVISL